MVNKFGNITHFICYWISFSRLKYSISKLNISNIGLVALSVIMCVNILQLSSIYTIYTSCII